MMGLKDFVIVRTGKKTLIMKKEKAEELKISSGTLKKKKKLKN